MFRHIFLFACVVVVSFSATAESTFRIAPHIQNITKDGATLIWETTEDEIGSATWGVKGGDLSDSVNGAASGKLHRVRIDGLSAGTEYTYSISTGSDTQTATFITAPESDAAEVTFIVVGDSRRWGDRWHATRMKDHAEQWKADFYMTMGDLVGDGHQYVQWPEHFDRYKYITDSKWFVTARGNHEGSQIRGTDQDWYAKYHELPGDGEPYASFEWGNTHFVLISYESTGREKDWTSSAKWLDDHLQSVDSQYTVVAHHFPVYCTGYYGYGKSRKEPGINAAEFRKVLDKHNVDLNCSGHTHIYERHYPLKNDQRNDQDGTWYVVNGGDINANYPDWWTAVSDDRQTQDKPTYTVYHMKADRIVARTFAWSKATQSIEEIDYFVIAQDESIPEKILDGLSNQSGDALAQDIKDLGALLHAPAARPLLSYLNHGDKLIRRAAADSLSILGNADIAEDLLPFLTDEDGSIAENAARSIEVAMPSKLSKKIAKLILDESTGNGVKFHLVGALQFHAPDKIAFDTMAKLLESGVQDELRNRTSYAIGEVSSSKNTRALTELIRDEESKYVTMTLGHTLNRVSGNRVKMSSRNGLEESAPGERREFIERWTK